MIISFTHDITVINNCGKMSSLVENFVRHLEARNYEEAWEEVRLITKLREYEVEPIICDVVGATINYLTESGTRPKSSTFFYCKNILILIAEKCYSMDVLLEFLEHIEYQDNDIKFLVLLDPLSECIREMKFHDLPERDKATEWCVNTIKSYVEDLSELVDDVNQDIINERILDVYQNIMRFVNKLLYAQTTSDIEEQSLYQHYLLSLIISLYGEPFCSLNTENVQENTYILLLDNMMGNAFNFADDTLQYLDIVSNRCKKIIDKETQHGNDYTKDQMCSMIFELSNSVSNLAYANFYFHIITKEGYWKKVPQVYNFHYIFEMCIYFVKILLCKKQEVSIKKGLTFMEELLKHISLQSIDFDVLSLNIYIDLFMSIINIMVYCDYSEPRKMAVQVFKQYIKVFNMKATYSIISYLYENNKHSGVISLITNILKYCVVECLNSTPRNPYFLGKKLELMLKKIYNLPNGSSTDLVEISDQVITTLNLLRYLFLRDKCNETGVWDMKDAIESDYLKPLREGVDLCRAHWKVKLMDLEQQKSYSMVRSNEEMKNADTEVTLTIGGEQLPMMPITDKIGFCHQAINGLDIMESIIIRVNECINPTENEVEQKDKHVEISATEEKRTLNHKDT